MRFMITFGEYRIGRPGTFTSRRLLLPLLTKPRRSRDVLRSSPSQAQDTPHEEVFRLSIVNTKEPTSGLEPLTCSLRVSGLLFLGFARACNSRIDKRSSVPSIARYCRVLRPG